ncbi:nucleolin [Clonorchis sinensis]|nr:nucleolin [Clonorchis sinensis]
MPKATASQHSSADAKPAIPKVDKVHAADTKKSTAPNHTGLYKHLLIPNPPRDLPQLKKVLSERGFSVEHLEPLNLRVAVAKVSANSDTKNLPSGEKALSVDGKTVHFLLVEGSSDAIALLAPETSESLFITGIPKFVTMEMLLSKLPRGCQPVSNKLLDKGRRNQHFNAAFLGFSSKSDSATAFTALLNVKFGDRTINVAYSHSREAPNAEESKSARQFQVRILNAPKDAVTDQILPLFPGATKAYRTNTGHFFVEFPDEAALRKATAGQKVLQKNVLRLSVPGGIEGNVYLIRNIPFDASESDLRNVYPEASKISLNRRHDGAFDGSAVVEFPSAASAQSALQKGVTLKGRRLFGIPFFVEIRTEKMSVPKKQPKADQKAPKPSKKSEVPPQVGSGSEEESEDDGGESDDDDQIPQKFNVKETGDKEKEESASEDDEDEDESDDDDEDEDDEEDESAASEDEGIEDASDEEMPMEKPREKSKFTPSKNQFGGQDKKDRGSNWRGGRGFSPRGNRGFGGRGRGGPNRGGHDGGFKHRGGGGGRGRGSTMTAAAVIYPTVDKFATSLTVYNIPFTADEEEFHELFPAARNVRIFRMTSRPAASQNTCVMQFSSPNDCHKAFAECQGKELGGRTLHAEYGEATEGGQPPSQRQTSAPDSSYGYHQSQGGSYLSMNPPYGSRSQPDREGSASRGRYQERGRNNDDPVLIVSNIPYSATEKDIQREFRDACNITLNLDDRGRSSGVAQLTFRTREQCEAALHACNNKMLNGRTLRGRLNSSQGRFDSGNTQRNYENRPSYQSNYNSNRREFDDGRRPRGGGGDWRGSRGFRDGGRDFNRGGRPDRFGSRRERSPQQGEPVRGYAASKGFRITSAVIQAARSPSSESSSGQE